MPTPRSEQVVRPRLLEHLSEAWDRKATVLSAPAGYGKTTLLAQWLRVEEAGWSFAWVSLDEQDNDPVRMWRHILEAVRRAVPEEEDFGSETLTTLNVAGKRLVEITLPILVNECVELARQVVVVLDDYQAVTEERCHESVTYFLEHLPDNVHLVLASRTDPPLSLGRLRARGELGEIRTEQLTFSKAEVAQLLNERMGLDIDPEDLSVLLERTEGWPAGIYLAALSLQNREDKHGFITSFCGSNRYVVDLLGEEVLADLTEEVRTFLLMTSVLKRMTGPLCDAVVGRKDSSNVLRELARHNLFVVPLDEGGEWYRYHHLFSDLLLYELKSTRPDLVPILHERASAWLEGEQYFVSAIRHAVAAEDYERAGRLVARHWYGYVIVGQTKTVQRWLESLPEELTTSNAALLLVKAWLCAFSGQREETETLLALAESSRYEGPLPDGSSSVETSAATLRAVFALGGVRRTLEAARLVEASEGERTSQYAALVRFGLGGNLYLSGETSAARQQLEETLQLVGSGQPVLRLVSLSFLSLVAGDEERLEEAYSLASEACALVERFRLQDIPQSSWAPIVLGCVLAQRGEKAEAQTKLESALSTRRAFPGLSPWPTLICLLALAPVRSALGDRGGAREALKEARGILEPFGDDAGIFPEILERQERKLRKRKQQDGGLHGELTEREHDVLKLLVEGLSTRQAAQRLYVAPSTVRTQVKSIYRKLGVSSREKAVGEANARGLI